MSTPLSSYLTFVTQQIVTYVGMFTATTGLLGGLLNLIVFLSLKTFRENSCAVFLIVMSTVNMGQLFTGQLSRVLITGFGVDWTRSSLAYCKFRAYALQVFGFISLTSLCLATIDQYLSTCARPNWQQIRSIQLSRRLCIATTLFWMIYGIPYFIFYNHSNANDSQTRICVSNNEFFRQFHSYVNNIVLTNGLPEAISVFFCTLAYRNIRQIAYRTVPLVRRELDKQLTNMVLVQVAFSFFAIVPFMIISIPAFSSLFSQNADSMAKYNLIANVTACFYYFHFAVRRRKR